MVGELVLGAVMGVVVVVTGLRVLRSRARARRFAREGLTRDDVANSAPEVLVGIGLSRALRDGPNGKVVGGCATIEGVEVSALEVEVAIPGWTETHYQFSIPLAPLAPRVSLTQEGVTATKGDIVLGDPSFDDRFAIVGDRHVAVTCLDHHARAALLTAADEGWRAEGPRLARTHASVDGLLAFIRAGARAVKALQFVDEAQRLVAIVASDPCQRMRRRAMMLLAARHSGHAEIDRHTENADPIIQLFATWFSRDGADWLARARELGLQGTGVIEIAEALVERRDSAALPLIGELLQRGPEHDARVALEAARDQLRLITNAAAGALAMTDKEAGGLSVSD